jgi:F-type H+-transporting ATPase subunit c
MCVPERRSKSSLKIIPFFEGCPLGKSGFTKLKYIGAGLAAFGMIGAGLGLGNVFGSYFNAVARQPSMEKALSKYLFMGFALVEAIAILAFVLSILIMNA